MQTKLNPYINFYDQTRAAMEFYHSVFGGKLSMATFKDYHAAQDPSEENLIMHAQLDTDNGMTLMGADTPKHLEYQPGTNNFSVSLSGDNEAELTEYYNKLSVGGSIGEPLTKAPWGDTFGMFTDRFGISWLINIAAKKG
jgi:PhnB protein